METTPTSTKGPSRKPHTKTRLGCNTCKARKVRCDQIKPVCQNCTRGNRTCVYASAASQGGSPAAQLSVTQAEVQDLELMHYYTISTHQILARLPDHYWIWQVQVPQMAFSHKYLLHGLLALTAMHRCHSLDESQIPNLVALARYHQQHALSLYIPLLQRIDSENCHALFAFSIVLTLLSFGILKSDDHNPQSLINGFTDICDSMFGAAAIATQAEEWLRIGPLGPIMSPLAQPKADLSDVEPSVRSIFEPLLQCAQSVCEEARSHQSPEDVASRHAAYMTSIMAMATIMLCNPAQEESDHTIAVVTAWPIMMISTSYVKLLKDRDPLALVILGNYGAVLQMAESTWIIQGLGQRLTEAVVAEVSPGWHPLLAWARSTATGTHTPDEVAPENNT